MRLVCPFVPYDDFALTIPDEFLVEHWERYAIGSRAAQDAFGDDVSANTSRFFGSLALCEKIENAPDLPRHKWPIRVYMWVINEVYVKRFAPEIELPSDFFIASPIMPKAE